MPSQHFENISLWRKRETSQLDNQCLIFAIYAKEFYAIVMYIGIELHFISLVKSIENDIQGKLESYYRDYR